MSRPNQKRLELSVRGKSVLILSFLSPEEIAKFSLNERVSKYARYRPLISNKETLIHAASEPDANVTLAVTPEGGIIGAGVLEYPAPGERWHRVGDGIMMEAAAIEVFSPWRSLGLSGHILNLLVDHPLKETRILYMVGYSWTWDLEGKGAPAMAYRNMLIRLFSREGFRIYETNEPNVMLRPENLFMARIGRGVSDVIQKRFKWVRFGLNPDL